MITIGTKYGDKKIRLNCTESYFQTGLKKFQNGHRFNDCFRNLRAAERSQLFSYLMTPYQGIR